MNIRLYHPDSILENTTSLLSKEHTHYVVNVMRLKRGSNLNFKSRAAIAIATALLNDVDVIMIHQIDLIVSVSGANLLQAFKGEGELPLLPASQLLPLFCLLCY